MRKFKTTPQKKMIGMLILFVLIPLFLLWYIVFFLDNKPKPDTLIILGACIVLGLYLYMRYKKQIDALAGAKPAQPEQAATEGPEGAGEEFEEDLSDEELDEEVEEGLKKKA
jgi:hypothetical protein